MDIVDELVVHLSSFINFLIEFFTPFVHPIPDPLEENATFVGSFINMEAMVHI